MSPQTSRPKVVTVIAWLIMAKAAWLAFPTLMCLIPSILEQTQEVLRAEGYSFIFSVTWAWVGAVVRVVCGVALLRGQAWGRGLYFVYVPAAYLLNLYLYGFKPTDLIGLVGFGVFVVLLTRGPAAEYFSVRRESVHDGIQDSVGNWTVGRGEGGRNPKG